VPEKTTPASDPAEPHLEDAAAPDAKHADESEIRGEWRRAAEAESQSEHLRQVLDEARQAADRAHEADSLASQGLGTEAVEDQGTEGTEESRRTEEDAEPQTQHPG